MRQPTTLLEFLGTEIEEEENLIPKVPVKVVFEEEDIEEFEEDNDYIVNDNNCQSLETADKKSNEEVLKNHVEKNIKLDYDYARKNIKQVINDSLNMLPELTSLATELQTPEGYDAIGRFAKSIVDANDKLLLLSERLLKPSKGKEAKQVVNVNTQQNNGNDNKVIEGTVINNTTNNVAFLGNTEDLLSMIIDQQNKAKKALIDDSILEQNEVKNVETE